METGEPDYMSDDFLTACVKEDFRPGLIHSRLKQRELKMEKKRKLDMEDHKKRLPSKTLAMDRLQEGLEQPLGPENKGFSMLQKMGFKPGSSLGSSQSGIVEPIGITIKSNRQGLGREQAVKDLQSKKKEIMEKTRSTIMNVDDFRAGLSKKYRERDILLDLEKSKKACHKFDLEFGIEEPEEKWFWPTYLLPEQDDDEVDEDINVVSSDIFSPSEKLEMLTLYLRQSYLFCIWCGVQYKDETDINLSCSGPTKEDH